MDEENEKCYTPENDGASGVDYSPTAQPVKRKTHKGLRVAALVLVCILLGAAAGIGGTVLMHRYYVNHSDLSENAQRAAALVEGKRNTALDSASVDTGRLMTPSQVYAASVSSTVGIRTSVTATNFWGYTSTSAASGSGFIVSDNGYILTNYHVVENSDSITVSTFDGKDYPAELIGFDESSDIAVLKVEAEGLTPVVLGSSKALSVGEEVLAIGNPLGELTFSLTRGIVSALDREVTLSGNLSMKLIQTDCAINSGNSGGALFNLYGEVVGITNAKYSSSSSGASIDNIGFAIPIDGVRTIFESIIEKGYVSKPFIGINIAPVSEEAMGYGLPAGVAVQSIVEGGPAEKAGLQVYDIITAANGVPVTDNSALSEIVAAAQPGDVIELDVYRQGESLKLKITVEEKIQTAESQQQAAAQQQIPSQGGGDFYFPNPFSDFFNMFPW